MSQPSNTAGGVLAPGNPPKVRKPANVAKIMAALKAEAQGDLTAPYKTVTLTVNCTANQFQVYVGDGTNTPVLWCFNGYTTCSKPLMAGKVYNLLWYFTDSTIQTTVSIPKQANQVVPTPPDTADPNKNMTSGNGYFTV